MDEIVKQGMAKWPNVPVSDSDSLALSLLSARLREEAPGREMEFVVYGWSRTPIYVSGTSAWPIDDSLFDRIYSSRQPFWSRLTSGEGEYEVYLENDRYGIYALGYPATPIGFADIVARMLLSIVNDTDELVVTFHPQDKGIG